MIYFVLKTWWLFGVAIAGYILYVYSKNKNNDNDKGDK